MSADPWGGATRGRGWRQWRNEHREAFGDGVTYVATHAFTTAFVWLALAIALSVPALLLVLERALTQELGDRAANLSVQAYLSAELDGPQRTALIARLRAMPEVTAVEIVEPDAAIAELSEVLGVDVLAALGGENPIPASLLVYLRPDVATDAEARVLARLRHMEGIEEVNVDWQWRRRLQALTSLVSVLAWTLGVMLGSGAVIVANATVRMAIESRLEDVRVFALLGAGRAYLRRPFSYLGLLYGAGGGVLAAMLLSAGLLLLEARLDELAQSYQTRFTLTEFDLPFVLTLLAAAVALGLAGAASAVHGALRRTLEPTDW